MSTHHQGHHLSQTRDREPVLLLLELQLLERDDLSRRLLPRSKDDTVRSFLDVVESLVLVDRSAGHDGAVS